MEAHFSNPDSLATLTTAVNQALIETGRFFRSSGSIQSRTQLKRSIPAAHEQFQFALDNLSEQIFLAKAFLERDYEAIQSTKTESQPAQDEAMNEPAVKQEAEPAAPTPEKTEAGAEVKTEPQPATEDTTTTNPPPAAEPTQPQEPDRPVKTEKPEEIPATTEQSGGASTETKLDTGLSDTGMNDFDLHLDFGDDDAGNQNFLTGTNFRATTTTTTTGGGNESGPNPSNVAIPGGDAFDMEFQKVDTLGGSAPEGQQQQQQQQQQSQAPPAGEAAGGDQTEEVMGPGESSFDDLFMGSADLGGETGEGLLEGDGLMNLNELDDNWFT